MAPAADATARLRHFAQRARVDGWAAEAVDALRGAGLRPILLKGPAVRNWLYPADAPVSYLDVDLLVSPAEWDRTHAVLTRLGYVSDGWPQRVAADLPHARPYEREDGAMVDLHRVLHGLEAVPATEVWTVFSTATEALDVGGTAMEVPSVAARALHLGLSISPHEETGSKVRRDLELAAAVVADATWSDAAALARRLGVDGELGHRLTRVAATSELPGRLRLPVAQTPLYAALHAAGEDPPAGVISLLQLAGQRSRRARARYVWRKLWPPAPVLRDQVPLARRGRRGRAAARAAWMLWCAIRLPAAIARLRRLR